LARTRPLEEKAALARTFERQEQPLVADGRVRPVIDAALPMAEVREAHRRTERTDMFGKIVLVW
jgi:NADPH:quinone reductase-like Zn-dependent oxidoreductase